jgi:hypothetical protein
MTGKGAGGKPIAEETMASPGQTFVQIFNFSHRIVRGGDIPVRNIPEYPE